jgi:hypothetical protein
MKNEDWQGILILLGIIAIALFGGSQRAHVNGLFSNGTATPETKNEQNIQQGINKAQQQTKDLQKQIAIFQDTQTASIYKDKVSLAYVNRSATASGEYLTLRVNSLSTTTIPITGWKIKSLSSGNTVTIPQGVYLFFAGTINSREDIYVHGGDTVYIVTGTSPIGESFRINRCSGYLTQYQKFTPYISNQCPSPTKEMGASIPDTVGNVSCLDYIETLSSCRVPTGTIPNTWTYECRSFLETKLTYSSCINTHKNDKNFYKQEWRVYLSRSSPVWLSRRESLVLYDNVGKVVSTLSY